MRTTMRTMTCLPERRMLIMHSLSGLGADRSEVRADYRICAYSFGPPPNPQR
jgi:hypothetical protein